MFDRNAQLLGTEVQKAKSVGTTLRRFGGYFKRYGLPLALVAVIVVAGTYMQVLVPDLIGQAADCYLGPFAAQAAANESGFTDLLLNGGQPGQAENDAFSNCWYTSPDAAASTAAVLRGLGGLILLIAGLYIGSAALAGVQFYLYVPSGRASEAKKLLKRTGIKDVKLRTWRNNAGLRTIDVAALR